ncbi:MAG TPA: hypothetical protein VGE52_07015 [Pirellulales bacterium]
MSCPLLRRWIHTALFWATLATTAFAEDVQRTLIADFENDDWSKSWTPVRMITAARVTGGTGKAAPDTAGDHVLKIKTAGGAGLATNKGVRPDALGEYDAVEAWIYRPAPKPGETPQPNVIEFQFVEADGAKFWRKIELSHNGWKKIRAELPFFRSSENRLPRWSRIERVVLWFRDGVELLIDDLAVVKTNSGGATLQPDDLARLAFPGSTSDAVQTVTHDGVVVVTDRPRTDAEAVLEKLVAVQKRVATDLPFLDAPAFPVPLLIFNKHENYGAFIPRLAAEFASEAGVPTSDGFTALGIASSSWSPELKTERPVYVHEFIHALLSSRLDLPNHGEWLQEGLASHYQLQFIKQADFNKLVAGQLSDGRYKPLETLTNGEAIALSDYWQAATLCEMLLNDEKYRAKFPALVSAFRRDGSTDLRPLVEKELGVDFKTLLNDWRNFCEKTYRP